MKIGACEKTWRVCRRTVTRTIDHILTLTACSCYQSHTHTYSMLMKKIRTAGKQVGKEAGEKDRTSS